MGNGIGSTLRDARTRRNLGLEDVEGATKIRLRYLRAMENEEWDALPGGAYSRAFLRTYASYLGLDGDRLAEDYRDAVEAEGGHRPAIVEPASVIRAPRGERRKSRLALGALAGIALIAAVAGVALIGGGDSSSSRPAEGKAGAQAGGDGGSEVAAAPREVALRLLASAEVWVCLLDASGAAVIDGAIMEAGEEQGPFRSREFAVAFGNGEVSMLVNGEEADVPPSSSPVGYEIDRRGNLSPIPEGERPECA
jgi:hypothetical protein